MSFSADWLALREPADRAARDPVLLAEAKLYVGAVAEPCLVDLGAGTGATARAFADNHLRWRLVDLDPAFLDLARSRIGGLVETHLLDLGSIDALPLKGARMVTASALLDLMPQAWIETLATRLAAEGLAVYAALNYDGTLEWHPPRPEDETIRAAFNLHQLGDKGLGPALGPRAAALFGDAMRARGYDVRVAVSPWRLGPAQSELTEALCAGIAAAAVETGLAGTEAWVEARRASAMSGTMLVGHLDVLALPPGSSAQSKITSVPNP